MAKKEERNLNVTIKNQEDSKGEMLISVSSVIRQLKKYLAVWIAAAIIAGILGVVVSAVKTFSVKTPARALVSFTYPNIEKGLDPAGRKFEIESMKNPVIIERTLTELGIELDKLEDVRKNISFDYKIPDDAYDKLTAYNSVMDKATSGSLSAAQAMLDTKYYPTQFTVYFDFGEAGFDRKTGVEVLNTLLENYRDYFYEQYGYNEPLGAAVNVADYENYDYAQQVDLFRDSLRQVRSYLNSLSRDDNTTFRSSITGYSFKDLSEYAKTVSSIDLDRISSYISVNNVTKNKDAALAYYDYRIENLNRDKDEYAERLAALETSIAQYEKDSILIFGNGTDSTNTQYATASDQYDSLFRQKTSVEANLAQTKQDIKFYESRRDALKNNKNSSKDNVAQVEADIKALSEKVANIVDLTEKTADDYYENVQFANAYNILIPATKSVGAGIGEAVKSAVKPLFIIEALIFMIYFAIAFLKALKSDNKKILAEEAAGSDDDDDADEADLEDVIDAIEEEAEEIKEKAEKVVKNNNKKKK
ncbi:MAG: lipopolysaccharide biosynthesis protein [Ruminococcus sp.]|nr:lipopolysaccharide biosynthesis protein [Ruminococcus sp.]